MNTRLSFMGWRGLFVGVVLAAAQVGCGGPPPAPAEAPSNPPPEPQAQPAAPATDSGSDDVAVDDFVEPLSYYGTWIDDPRYGRIWQPGDEFAGENFTPYTSDGGWAANDDGSWVFQSKYDNEFGWATYHYGRWVDHDDYGWVWIPGTTWAPSWVDWRYGGGYVGWAPMGPPGVEHAENHWVFVEQAHFTEPAVVSFRLAPERAHVAFTTAAPLVEVRGGGHWTVGPAFAQIKAGGGVLRSVHIGLPAHGATKAFAKASLKTASTTRAGKAPSKTPVKRGSTAARGAHAAGPQPAGHDAHDAHDAHGKTPPAAAHGGGDHHDAGHADHGGAADHHGAAPAKPPPAAKPPAAKPAAHGGDKKKK